MEGIVLSPIEQLNTKISEAQSSYSAIDAHQAKLIKELETIKGKWFITNKSLRKAQVLNKTIDELELVKKQLNTYREIIVDLKNKIPTQAE